MLAIAGLASTPAARAQGMGGEAGPATGAQFTLGAGAIHAPRYEGADRYKTRALPFIDYRSGRCFASALGGIGYDFSPVADLQFGPVLSYRLGKTAADSPITTDRNGSAVSAAVGHRF